MMHKLRGSSNRDVWLDGAWLDPQPSLRMRNHSPTGFNWGYGGSGPAQLALAIVLYLTGKPDGYQDLKWNVIARIPKGPFEINFEHPEIIEKEPPPKTITVEVVITDIDGKTHALQHHIIKDVLDKANHPKEIICSTATKLAEWITKKSNF